MGWCGRQVWVTPYGQDRINYVIKEEGLNSENERYIWKPIASSIYGNTVYFAVERTDKETGEKIVFANVCLTRMDKNGFLMIKSMDESAGPGYYDCPKRILDMLTAPCNEYAANWRKKCNEHRHNRTHDPLLKCPLGTMVKREDTGAVLEAYQHGAHKVFVNWQTRSYLTASRLRRIGYTIL